MALRAWASTPDWDRTPNLYDPFVRLACRADSESGATVGAHHFRSGPLGPKYPGQLSPRPSFAQFRSLPFGWDAIRNVHMCLWYHLYLYMYMYIVRTGGRPARNLYIMYVARLRAGENHSDSVRVHTSKIESWHFTIHFLFRSTMLWKMIGEYTSTHVVTSRQTMTQLRVALPIHSSKNEVSV